MDGMLKEMMEIFYALLHLLQEMSPYLLLGFFVAGLLHVYVPQRFYARHLSRPSLGAVLKAALLGVPLPLCSCGVIPTAVGLHRDGASRGATTAFLISTPQTGIDSIMATYGLMGLPFALLRPIVAFVTGILGGVMVNRFGEKAKDAESKAEEPCGERPASAKSQSAKPSAKSFIRVLHYAYVEMLRDVAKWLVIGLVAAALITVLVPENALTVLQQWPLLSMGLVLVCAVPMYLCATGSIPIAVSLMLKGLTPGAALVMLMAGPATNVASLLVLQKTLGRRTAALYLLAIVLGAVGTGLLIDYCFPAHWFAPTLMSGTAACCAKDFDVFGMVCTVILTLLLLYAFWSKRHGAQCACCASHAEASATSCCCHEKEAAPEPEHSCCCGHKEEPEPEHSCCCGHKKEPEPEHSCCCGHKKEPEPEHSCCCGHKKEPEPEHSCCCKGKEKGFEA